MAWLYKGEPSFDGDRWHDTHKVTTSQRVATFHDENAKPLYATPHRRKPLTEDELDKLMKSFQREVTMEEVARAVEQAHGIFEEKTMNRNEIITNMCYTWRHDFGLDRQDDNPLSSGMTKDERSMLYLKMQQVFNNCIEPHMEFKNK